jgi:DNA-binding phage protein
MPPLTGWPPGLNAPDSAVNQGAGRQATPRRTVSDEAVAAHREATILDRVHAAMIVQASGSANAFRVLLKIAQELGLDSARLANALSALYPKNSEKKCLLDAMLLGVPGQREAPYC